MPWDPLWSWYELELDHDAGTPRDFSSDGRWGKEARKTSDADAQEDTSVHAFGNYHFENHAVLLKIQEHPDWLKYNKTDLTLLPNGSTDSFGMPWVPSSMDEPIEIGRFEPGHNHIGDVFDVSWMNTTNPLFYPGSPAPAPLEEIEISPQLSTPIGNASIVPWTFGSCPLIIPDQSFEGMHNSHAYQILLRHLSHDWTQIALIYRSLRVSLPINTLVYIWYKRLAYCVPTCQSPLSMSWWSFWALRAGHNR